MQDQSQRSFFRFVCLYVWGFFCFVFFGLVSFFFCFFFLLSTLNQIHICRSIPLNKKKKIKETELQNNPTDTKNQENTSQKKTLTKFLYYTTTTITVRWKLDFWLEVFDEERCSVSQTIRDRSGSLRLPYYKCGRIYCIFCFFNAPYLLSAFKLSLKSTKSWTYYT